MPVDLPSVMILLTLQLVALGWRVRREVSRREPHPFPWVPVPDNVNIASMLALLYTCVLVPLWTPWDTFILSPGGQAMFGAAAVLIVAHPLVVASHYGLWAGARRASAESGAQPYCTRQEAVVQLVALAAAAWVFVRILPRTA